MTHSPPPKLWYLPNHHDALQADMHLLHKLENANTEANSQQVKLAPCPQVDSALHILSGCQHTQIRNMITERHNIACRMIFKAISKTGSLGSCIIVSKDIGSNERMTMQNLQVPETAESRFVPKWLFPPRFPDKD